MISRVYRTRYRGRQPYEVIITEEEATIRAATGVLGVYERNYFVGVYILQGKLFGPFCRAFSDWVLQKIFWEIINFVSSFFSFSTGFTYHKKS